MGINTVEPEVPLPPSLFQLASRKDAMLPRLVALVSLWALPVAYASQWAPTEVLRISNANIASDCTYRPSAVINGTSPGPILRFKEGEHIWIRVYNDLVDSNTTLHFHGLSQYASPFADGTPQTSQVYLSPIGVLFTMPTNRLPVAHSSG